MKTLIKLSALTLAIVSLFSINANAQDGGKTTTTGSGIRLSVGPDFGLPVGSFKDAYNWSVGGSVQADFPILQDQLYVTVNGGYQNYFAKEINGVKGENLQLIPAKAGLKYFPVQNFYVQGEARCRFPY